MVNYIRSHPSIRQFFRESKTLFVCLCYGLKNVHRTAYFGGKSALHRDIEMGPYSYVGPGCSICPKVRIGAYTMLAPEVLITGGDHVYSNAGMAMIFSGRAQVNETTIGKDCWIGQRAVIITGVTIGDGAIVAAGSVVTKDIEPFTIAGGVPAKKIGDRFSNQLQLEAHRKYLAQNVQRGTFCRPR